MATHEFGVRLFGTAQIFPTDLHSAPLQAAVSFALSRRRTTRRSSALRLPHGADGQSRSARNTALCNKRPSTNQSSLHPSAISELKLNLQPRQIVHSPQQVADIGAVSGLHCDVASSATPDLISPHNRTRRRHITGRTSFAAFAPTRGSRSSNQPRHPSLDPHRDHATDVVGRIRA